jgi:SAM-dependent methyltransferase
MNKKMKRMDKKIYSEHWAKESESLDKQGIYKRLSEITPEVNTIEIGCGTGLTSRYLASKRKVISIDNNEHLIKKTALNLKNINDPPQIIHADIFDLNADVSKLIEGFSPEVAVGWFIGSHADDIDRQTSSSLQISERPKVYREKIEDLILTKIAGFPTAEWVHLAHRVGLASGANVKDIIKAEMDDYNTHVFHPNGFEVAEVEILNWDRNGSEFIYAAASNPNLAHAQVIPSCISILAKRIKT